MGMQFVTLERLEIYPHAGAWEQEGIQAGARVTISLNLSGKMSSLEIIKPMGNI